MGAAFRAFGYGVETLTVVAAFGAQHWVDLRGGGAAAIVWVDECCESSGASNFPAPCEIVDVYNDWHNDKRKDDREVVIEDGDGSDRSDYGEENEPSRALGKSGHAEG